MSQTDKTLQSKAKEAVEQLAKAQGAGSPLQISRARGAALIQGLMDLAHASGAEISRPAGIDSNGEIAVNGVGIYPSAGSPCKPYGETFARVISLVPRRMGMFPTSTPTPPENAWCKIDHFDMERLLKMVAAGAHMRKAAEPEDEGPSP